MIRAAESDDRPERSEAIIIIMEIELLARITIEKGKCGGRPCIRGKRLRVSDILGLLGARAKFTPQFSLKSPI